MSHFTVGVLGQMDNDFLKGLGNKGTINDIEFRNYRTDNDVVTYCAPKSEKVLSLMQIMGIIDFPVIVFDKPNSALGEAILAVETMEFQVGILCVSDQFGSERAKKLIEGTSMESFDLLPMDQDSFKEHILSPEFQDRIPRPDGPSKIPIDNYFPVKSVGTVILGIIKRGNLGVYTKLSLYPEEREVLVKSIQCQDKDVRNASTLQRVGLSLKGIKPDELKRGNIVAEKGSLIISKNIKFMLIRNNVLKDKISVGDSFFVSVGLQSPVGKVSSIENGIVSMDLERDIAFDEHDRAIMALTTPKPPRIVGGGRIIV